MRTTMKINCPTKQQRASKDAIARRHGYASLEEMLIAEYNNTDAWPTVADLAHALGVKANSIHRWRQILGIPSRRQLGGLYRGGWRHDVPNGEVLEHLAEGHTIDETAAYFECHRRLISRIKNGYRRDLV